MVRVRLLAAGMLSLALVTAGCGDDDSSDTGSGATTTVATPTTTAASAATTTTAGGVRSDAGLLRVLVVDDDGIGADGIDALVEALRQLPDTQVTVIAPKDNQSGAGSKSSSSPPAVTNATTRSGFPGKAVDCFPFDAVNYAFDGGGLPEKPHVVLSGVNFGANVGPLIDVSGTVGAAKAAARHGVPAFAASQGIAEHPDYASGVKYTIDWLQAHRADLLAGKIAPSVTSINVPTCATGSIRGLVEVPTATSDQVAGRDLLKSNCASTVTDPSDDVGAFGNGFVSQADVPFAA